MKQMKKVLAFSGSNSKASLNQRLVTLSSELINDENLNIEVISLRDYEAPIYGIDKEMDEGFPHSMKELKRKFDEVDGFLVSTPEHNGSMPAVLKNTIDWLSRMGGKVFQDKPTVFLSTSPGPRGGRSALEHLVAIMPYRGAKIVGHYSLGSFEENVVDGKLKESIEQELNEVLSVLVEELKL